MGIDYEKLVNLGYTAHQHSMDFEEKLEDNDVRYPSISFGKRYDDGVPVVEVEAQDLVTTEKLSESYRLEDVTSEEFEEVMYGIWQDTFRELEP